jgi:hypothetical protein
LTFLASGKLPVFLGILGEFKHDLPVLVVPAMVGNQELYLIPLRWFLLVRVAGDQPDDSVSVLVSFINYV